jgi:hypothetical protein
MFRLTFILLALHSLLSCSNSGRSPLAIDKGSQEKYTEPEMESIPTCVFDNPDTSLSGIKIRDVESANSVLKVKRLKGDTTYHFSTADKKQVLSVIVHPGDYYSQISIFQVKYVDSKPLTMTSLSVDRFSSEKNILLGLAKEELIAKLGNCYAVSDSTSKSITINYRLESPQDSKTKLLKRQSLPIYFAKYKFYKDKLIEFEFGFEYP